jgi:hypothetical protein
MLNFPKKKNYQKLPKMDQIIKKNFPLLNFPLDEDCDRKTTYLYYIYIYIYIFDDTLRSMIQEKQSNDQGT